MKVFIKNNSREILAAFVLSATLFLFAPISIFIANSNYLNFNLIDLFPVYFLVMMIISLVLLVTGLIIKKFYPFISVFLAGICLSLTLEGYFLDYGLGVLDGRRFSLEFFQDKLLLDSVIWAVVITASVLFGRYLYKHIGWILLFILIYQATSNLTSFIIQPPDKFNEPRYFDSTRKFEFSSTTNVVVIVLDSFRSEGFQESLQRYPEYQEAFKDFIFYENALGGYPTTMPSIPLLLTGEFFDNSMTFDEFINAQEPKSLPFTIKNSGFSTELYSIHPYFNSLYDNQTQFLPLRNRILIAINQYIVCGVRYAPLLLKPTFIVSNYRGGLFSHRDIVDFGSGVDQTLKTDRPPVFKFFHLTGAHRPYQLDKALNRSDKGYIEQAAASLTVVKDLLIAMDNQEVYDNSLIIILGDHGSVVPDEYYGKSLAYVSQPLLLAKRVNQRFDEMVISNAPVSIQDIPVTITNELEIPNSYKGYSIFDSIPMDRIRNFYYYVWKQSTWNKDFIDPMYAFDILGPANVTKSYKLVQVSTGSSITQLTYRFSDNLISTILSDDNLRFLTSYNLEYDKNNNEVWALGPQACINLTVDAVNKPLTLVMETSPFLVDGQLDDQAMIVSLDRTVMATFHNNDELTITISADDASRITQDGVVEICFEFPDAIQSPGNQEDNEAQFFGYKFTSIVIK